MSIPELPNDLYLEIAKNADDRTILNMLLVDKKHYNDNFFRILLERKYPLLIKFKESGQNYRQLYLRMTHYLALLKEEYNFPYIPHPEFNPVIIYNNVDRNNTGLGLAAEIGDMYLIKELISIGADDFNTGMVGGIISGNRDIVNYFISLGADDWNYGLMTAAVYDRQDLIKFYMSQEDINPNFGLVGAAEGGHKHLIDYFLSLGAEDRDHSLMAVVESAKINTDRKKELIYFFIGEGARNIVKAAKMAENLVNKEIANYLWSFTMRGMG